MRGALCLFALPPFWQSSQDLILCNPGQKNSVKILDIVFFAPNVLQGVNSVPETALLTSTI
jgi:hypothetical protein